MKNNFKLSRITSKFDKGYFNIYQFGYDENNKFVTKVDKIRDYFYYSANNIDDIMDTPNMDFGDTQFYDSFNGEKVNKVFYNSIKIKNKIVREKAPRTYHGDVSPEFKHILDKGLEWTNNRHIIYYDIETWVDLENPTDNKPENAKQPITSIQCYSTDKKQYFVFAWHPEKTKDLSEPSMKTEGNTTYVMCKDEEDVIMGFINLLSISHCDILTGWYCSGYDMPYIINRCKKLGLPYEEISPIKDVFMKRRGEYWRINIRGLDHVDMMEALQDMGYNLPNWKLATASKEILGMGEMEKLTEVTWRDWIDNFDGFIKYGIRDVQILKEISEKIQMFELYTTLQQISNIEILTHAFFKSVVVDNYILKEFHGQLAFPTRRTGKRQNYAGAIVFNPTEPGRHKDVTVMDYTSLYPTSIMAFNISPETFICSKQQCDSAGFKIDEVIDKLKSENTPYIDTGEDSTLFGDRYLFYGHDEKEGLLPYVLRKLFLKRVEINKNLSEGKYKGDEKIAMEKRQWTYKIILNSAYGAMGFPFFRLYKPECADAITYFARQALKFATVKFNSDHKVLYGDTDSIFVKSNGKSEHEMKNALVEFNHQLRNEFIAKYNTGLPDEYMLMDLKFEYDLEYIYFGNSKKRYYGIVRDTGKKYIRGMNIIRKDAPTFLKKALNVVTEMAVRDKLTLDHLVKLRQKITTIDYKDIGISKKFTKKFNQYTKNKPQHIKASMWANDKLGTSITHTDTPYLFYIKSKCEDDLKPKERQTAICLNEEDLHLIDKHNEIFEIDYDTYYKKQVTEQLKEFDLIPNVKKLLENEKNNNEFNIYSGKEVTGSHIN